MYDFKSGPNFKKFQGKTILAVDFGKKFTGLSIFCPGKDPYPLAFGRIAYENNEQLILELKKIINDEFIDVLVIGIPYFLDGKESKMTLEVKNFYDLCVSQFSQVMVLQQDETLSSTEAKERMENSPQYNFKVDLSKIDAVSACIILEDFLRAN